MRRKMKKKHHVTVPQFKSLAVDLGVKPSSGKNRKKNSYKNNKAENGMKLSDKQVKTVQIIVIQLKEHVDDNKNVKYEQGEAYVGEEERYSYYAPCLVGIIDEKFTYYILIVTPPVHSIEFDSDHNKYVGRYV
jgi:hypothetical protein